MSAARWARWGAVLAAALCLVAPPAQAQEAPPGAIELPAVFVETFLNFPEDAAEAARGGRRLLLYFGQDGCPYCKELLTNNFSQKTIVDQVRARFVPIGLNLWGDRETVWFDGKTRSEKELARLLAVQFTPTVLLLDEKGRVIARLNGYYPPSRFAAALDYAAQRLEGRRAFAEYMRALPAEGAFSDFHEQPFFLKAVGGKPLDLRRRPGGKPLAVLFETRHCAACDELHREGFSRAATLAALRPFDVARFSLTSPEPLLTPDGGKRRAAEWARALGIGYTPSLVFFDSAGREVFRIEAYVRAFHLASAFDYVGSGAYRQQPEFQRFLQERAERLKQQGEAPALWN